MVLLTSADVFISRKAAVMYALSVTSSDTPPCRQETGSRPQTTLIPADNLWSNGAPSRDNVDVTE